jgi:DNA-binding MarR family transcriptional regulator
MVKKIDDVEFPPLIDHIGWLLWQASASWHAAFETEMVARGHTWFAEARGAVFRFLGPGGVRQAALQAQLRISKQAVQQMLDQLETDNIIKRETDAGDSRAKRVVLTRKGLLAAHDANAAKRKVEDSIRRKLGAKSFQSLLDLLTTLNKPD